MDLGPFRHSFGFSKLKLAENVRPGTFSATPPHSARANARDTRTKAARRLHEGCAKVARRCTKVARRCTKVARRLREGCTKVARRCARRCARRLHEGCTKVERRLHQGCAKVYVPSARSSSALLKRAPAAAKTSETSPKSEIQPFLVCRAFKTAFRKLQCSYGPVRAVARPFRRFAEIRRFSTWQP